MMLLRSPFAALLVLVSCAPADQPVTSPKPAATAATSTPGGTAATGTPPAGATGSSAGAAGATDPSAATNTQAPQDPAPPARKTPPPYRAIGVEVPPQTGHVLLARDPATGDLGAIALTAVPGGAAHQIAGRAGVGIVGMLGIVDPGWAEAILDGLAAGRSPQELLDEVTRNEVISKSRQVVVMAADGRRGAFFGRANHAATGDSLSTAIPETTENELYAVNNSAMFAMTMMAQRLTATTGTPLAERLLNCAKIEVMADAVERPFVSGRLLVLRKGGGLSDAADNLVDVRVDYDVEPIDRMSESYVAYARAVIGPRIRAMQKALSDPQGPVYRSNLDWLRRLRTSYEIGVADK